MAVSKGPLAQVRGLKEGWRRKGGRRRRQANLPYHWKRGGDVTPVA